jgi:hypothetical protein
MAASFLDLENQTSLNWEIELPRLGCRRKVAGYLPEIGTRLVPALSVIAESATSGSRTHTAPQGHTRSSPRRSSGQLSHRTRPPAPGREPRQPDWMQPSPRGQLTADSAGGTSSSAGKHDQNSLLCALLNAKLQSLTADQNGGYRAFCGAQRKLQRVTEGQRFLVPDHRIGSPVSRDWPSVTWHSEHPILVWNPSSRLPAQPPCSQRESCAAS